MKKQNKDFVQEMPNLCQMAESYIRSVSTNPAVRSSDGMRNAMLALIPDINAKELKDCFGTLRQESKSSGELLGTVTMMTVALALEAMVVSATSLFDPKNDRHVEYVHKYFEDINDLQTVRGALCLRIFSKYCLTCKDMTVREEMEYLSARVDELLKESLKDVKTIPTLMGNKKEALRLLEREDEIGKSLRRYFARFERLCDDGRDKTSKRKLNNARKATRQREELVKELRKLVLEDCESAQQR